MTTDHLQSICWSITYVFLIIYAIKYRTHGIPLTAICLNFSWETLALFSSLLSGQFSIIMVVHIVWFTLDCIMIALFLFYESKIGENKQEKIKFACAYLICTVFLAILFARGYMLLSCFVIDLIMAVSFVVFLTIKPTYIGWIIYAVGIFKLLGDLFAWIYYRNALLINYIGIIVLSCNIIYLLVLIYKTVKVITHQKTRL